MNAASHYLALINKLAIMWPVTTNVYIGIDTWLLVEAVT